MNTINEYTSNSVIPDNIIIEWKEIVNQLETLNEEIDKVQWELDNYLMIQNENQ